MTVLMFTAVRAVLLLPELPLLRLRLVPAFWYFLTFSKIVLATGGLQFGNLSRKAFVPCGLVLF